MKKTLGSPLSQVFCNRFVEMRKAAGLTQRDLALKLGRERSFVARIELGERRVDLLEFFSICQALNVDPVEATRAIYAGVQQHHS